MRAAELVGFRGVGVVVVLTRRSGGDLPRGSEGGGNRFGMSMWEREKGGGGVERLEVEKNGGGGCGDLGGTEEVG